MNKSEAVQILAILKAAYPNSYRGMTKEDARATAAVWAMQFADMPVEVVMMAVNKAISTNEFPPSIAEVKKKLHALHWEAKSKYMDKQYRQIIAVTERYRSAPEVYEPGIDDMLPVMNQMLLNGGSG